ncbi:uncharacterized protein LOC116194703 [Punica granatum]|uniref:Uncharacterized protein LOC116194703 n=1 Tax=Punica granatum TaxID=22663 RepID=A0A6P8CD89_PUNGR|nr:uncharacterized protein LOC116194703 [Punica granatum]XP_031379447.1 uncharacterized protein LOC116194703 [Punica granatum]XP_031379449.1 uncharacterized protein LOC116194703 [Punica granatum]
MRSTDSSGPSSPFASLGRSVFGFRREQVHSTGSNPDSDLLDSMLESFQKQVTDRFHELSGVSDDELLSFAWVCKLLDAFICCQDEFKLILLSNKELIVKHPTDRMVNEFFEKSVKALDICNATRDGIEKVRLWLKHLDIVMSALASGQRTIGEGQVRRARKALVDLALGMLEEKDNSSVSVLSHRHRSFGRHAASKDHSQHRLQRPGHSRSLSWSVSRSWSAAKQLQSIANNLVPPRASEIIATSGFAIPLFTISFVLAFVLWALVAAIPCQDRGININFSVPRNFPWAGSILSLHERILEESRKRNHKNANGLLKEIYQMEKCTEHLMDLLDFVHFPLTEEQNIEIERQVEELGLVCEALVKGLEPLELQVREMFRRIMNCRTEGLEFLCRAGSMD